MSSSAVEQLQDVMKQLQLLLQDNQMDLRDSVFIHLYLSDMKLFGLVNEEYCKWFEEFPPSRCCVEIQLSSGIQLALYCTFHKESYQAMKLKKRNDIREVLHVRSMSDWAPLCIGPYAQSNKINNSLVFVAGQIPLQPGTMQLLHPPHPGPHYTDEEVIQDLYLSLRHIDQVLRVNHSDLNRALFFLVYVNTKRIQINNDRYLRELFRTAVQAVTTRNQSDTENTAEDDDDEYEEEEEKVTSPSIEQCELQIPVLFVYVPDLPRNASVEVESIGVVRNVIAEDRWIWVHETTSNQNKAPVLRSQEIFFGQGISPRNYEIQRSSLYYPRCISSHCLEIREAQDYAEFEISSLEGMMSKLSECLTTSVVQESSLIAVTLFYASSLFDRTMIERSVLFQLGKWGINTVALTILPTNESLDSLFKLLVYTVDFSFLETESWIFSKK